MQPAWDLKDLNSLHFSAAVFLRPRVMTNGDRGSRVCASRFKLIREEPLPLLQKPQLKSHWPWVEPKSLPKLITVALVIHRGFGQ